MPVDGIEPRTRIVAVDSDHAVAWAVRNIRHVRKLVRGIDDRLALDVEHAPLPVTAATPRSVVANRELRVLERNEYDPVAIDNALPVTLLDDHEGAARLEHHICDARGGAIEDARCLV